MAYAFLAGSPVRVKQLLRANSCVDLLVLNELLDQVRTILKDDSALEEPIVIAAQANQSSVRSYPGSRTRIVCHKCNGWGHVARSCMDGK